LFDDGSRVARVMRNKVADHQYPPRMIVDIYYHKEQADCQMLNVTLLVKGVNGISDSDKSVCFHVHSSMFISCRPSRKIHCVLYVVCKLSTYSITVNNSMTDITSYLYD